MNIWTKSSARSARRSGARENSGALRTGGCPSFSFPGCGDLYARWCRISTRSAMRHFPTLGGAVLSYARWYGASTRSAAQKPIPRESGIKAHPPHAATARAKTRFPRKAQSKRTRSPRLSRRRRKKHSPRKAESRHTPVSPAPVAAAAQKPVPRESGGITARARFPVSAAARGKFRCMLRREFV